jgi:hypothetical protein
MSESSTAPTSSTAPPDPSSLDAWVLGRIGYEAYGKHPGAHGPWTTFDGRPMPTWPDLQQSDAGQLTRDRWAAAALAIAAEIEQRRRAFWAEAEEDTGQVDPFLMGIREIAAATRDLAEASTLLSTSDSDASKAVAALVQDMAKCLSAQVRELTPPPQS